MARNKARTSMAIVGIIGCTMLIVCAFGLLDSMNAYLDWEFDEICNFEYKLALESDYTDEEINNLTLKYGDSTSQTLGIEIKNKDTKETNIITINDSNNKLRYTDHNKDYIELNNDGVYITEKLSKTLDLNVEDEITWHIFGDENWYTTKIVGLNRDPQSQQLNMTRQYYESLELTYHADSIYTDEDLSNTKELDGVETIQSIDSLKSGMQSMLGTMKTVVVLLIIVSVILGFVIIYIIRTLVVSFIVNKVLAKKVKNIDMVTSLKANE